MSANALSGEKKVPEVLARHLEALRRARRAPLPEDAHDPEPPVGFELLELLDDGAEAFQVHSARVPFVGAPGVSPMSISFFWPSVLAI